MMKKHPTKESEADIVITVTVKIVKLTYSASNMTYKILNVRMFIIPFKSLFEAPGSGIKGTVDISRSEVTHKQSQPLTH